MKRLLIVLLLLKPVSAFSWGDIGHEDIVLISSRALNTFLKNDERNSGLDSFFESRRFVMGYLANIPDTDWRDPENMKFIAKIGLPGHYLNVENVLGIPGKNIEEYLDKIRNIPVKYEDVKKLYNGKPNALEMTPASRKNVNVYYDLGTAPWRVKQFYNLLISAFKCAASKPLPSKKFVYVDLKKVFPESDGNKFQESYLKSYECNKSNPIQYDYLAALVLAGVLSHSVQDIGQPYHITMDYDGWVTGNGGIHKYFETDIVGDMDEKVRHDTYVKFLNKAYQKNIQKRLRIEKLDFSKEDTIVQLILNLAADSFGMIDKVRAIDDQFGIKGKRSNVLPWGVYPHEGKIELKDAERVSSRDPKVRDKFRPVIIERYALSSWVIGKILYEAWVAGGKPKLPSATECMLNFPHQPSYIWPDFDVDAVKHPRT
jgi:acyl carrier protein